jgi:two-component system, sensor histidine kinase PdtaS
MDSLRERLSEIDLVDRMALALPAWVVQVLIGLAFFGAALLVRAGVDVVAMAAGPFSLIYPAIMLATLYGRWCAGLVTWLACFLHAWYYVLPAHSSFSFVNPSDLARTIVNGASALVILFFAEVFRRAVSRASAERDAEIQTRDMLMQELDHRTKNNFAMVASLLDLQRRSSESEEVGEALALASVRVQSFAAIHGSIYSRGAFSDEIDLKDYLDVLAEELSAAYFPDDLVKIRISCAPVPVPRDRAVAIGLIVNEAVTNAAKHAFPEGKTGEIQVEFVAPADGPWALTIRDNGRGTAQSLTVPQPGKSGLGSKLMVAFAQKAGGTLETTSSDNGTIVRLAEAT